MPEKTSVKVGAFLRRASGVTVEFLRKQGDKFVVMVDEDNHEAFTAIQGTVFRSHSGGVEEIFIAEQNWRLSCTEVIKLITRKIRSNEILYSERVRPHKSSKHEKTRDVRNVKFAKESTSSSTERTSGSSGCEGDSSENRHSEVFEKTKKDPLPKIRPSAVSSSSSSSSSESFNEKSSSDSVLIYKKGGGWKQPDPGLTREERTKFFLEKRKRCFEKKTCFFCESPNHWLNNCPNRPGCNFCGSNEHTEQKCMKSGAGRSKSVLRK